MRKKLFHLLLGIFFLISSHAFAQTSNLKREELVQAFRQNMISDARKENAPIRKWSQDIRFFILGDGAEEPRLIEKAAHAFSEVGNVIPIKVHYDSNKPNFFVVFVKNINAEIDQYRTVLRPAFASDDALDKYLETMRNQPQRLLTLRNVNRDSEIAFYCVFIAMDRLSSGDRFSPENDLMRGVLGGLGLEFGAVNIPSVFNTKDTRAEFSEADLAMLKAYYSMSIKPGMPFDAAEPEFAKALNVN